MKITKLEHSGIAIEKNGEILVCDPVEFIAKLPVFQNVVAIIITHKHSDHFQPEGVTRILQTNPSAQIFTTADTAIEGATIVKAGDSASVGDFKLDFFGENHAAIVPGQVPCENIGVVVDDQIVNPGDSFDLPEIKPGILFVPIAAPWSKVCESMDFVEKALPDLVIPFHDAVLSPLGSKFNNNWLGRACDDVGADLVLLNPNQSIEV